MKKTCRIIIVICVMALSLCACGKDKETENVAALPTATPMPEIEEPDFSQIRSICELATLECFYHNVAKSTKEKGSGISHLGEKNRVFWIEYTGTAKIGIEMSELQMKVDGTDITIQMPKAKLISCEVTSIDEEDYISSEDSWFNKNPITAQEQTEAVEQAQEDMRKSVENNPALLLRAQERAKALIQNYITRLGEASGVEFHVKWEYAKEEETEENQEK